MSKMLSFNCQLAVLSNHLQESLRVRGCLAQVSLWEGLGGTDLIMLIDVETPTVKGCGTFSWVWVQDCVKEKVN